MVLLAKRNMLTYVTVLPTKIDFYKMLSNISINENVVILFASSFMIVCLLGLQSQFVRDKQPCISFLTSIGVGVCQVYQYRLAPNADTVESIFFVLGGACGIVASIHLHNLYIKIKRGKKL